MSLSSLKFLLYLQLLNLALCINRVTYDYVSDAYQTANMGSSKGGDKTPIYCSDGWVTGFKVFYDCDWYGLIYFEIYCSDWNGVSTTNTRIPNQSGFAGSWTSFLSCSSSNYVVGYKTCGCCCDHYNDLSLNDLNIYCSDGQELRVNANCGDTDNKGWASQKNCQAGTAMCGFRYQYDDHDSSIVADNTALNQLGLKCCRICDKKSTVFQSGTNCNFCHLDCTMCTGAANNQCTKCADSDTLSSGRCNSPSNIITVSEEFTGSTTTAFQSDFTSGGWSATSGFSFYTCADSINTWYMLGRISGTKTITKTLTSMIPHYKARIKVRYYKMDGWGGQSCKISIDGSALSISGLTNWQANDDSFYYGNICSGSGSENTVYISQDFTHKAASMTILFSSTLASGDTSIYWGISHVRLSVFRCHPTCRLCSGGEAINQCTACYTHATLQSDNTCICDNLYYPVTTSPCSTAICTVCTPCPTGCYKCTGPGPNQCSACITDYYLYNSDVNFFI